MDQLYKRIHLLPQVLQDLIGEYNAQHRNQMKQVLNEYFGIIYTNCLTCMKPFNKEIFCSMDYFINLKCGINYHWCITSCYEAYTDIETKVKYHSSIDNYLLTKTIQLPRQHMEEEI